MDKKHFHITGMQGSSRALLVSILSKLTANDIIVLFNDNDSLSGFKEEIEYFLENGSLFESLTSKIVKEFSFKIKENIKKHEVIVIPDFDIKVYSEIIPPLNIQRQRISALSLSIMKENKIILTTKEVFTKKIIPEDFLAEKIFHVIKGKNVEQRVLIEKLIDIGYTRRETVEESGDFAVRGGILDIFSPLYQNPARIELLGDEVNSIRSFSQSSQLTSELLDSFTVIPATEFIFDGTKKAIIKSKIKRLLRAEQLAPGIIERNCERVENREPYDGSLITPFFENPSTLFDYLNPEPILIYHDSIDFENYDKAIKSDYSEILATNKLCDTPNDLFTPLSMIEDKVECTIYFESQGKNDCAEIEIATESLNYIRERIDQNLALKDHEKPFAPFVNEIASFQDKGITIQIVLPSENSKTQLSNLLDGYGVDINTLNIQLGNLDGGFLLKNENIAIITASEIFGKSLSKTRSFKRESFSKIDIFSKISIGDFIVHADFGIGKFLGLKKIKIGNFDGDFLELEYKGHDILYIPVDRLNLVKRFVSSDGREPALDKLGGDSWKNRKKRVKEEMLKFAAELVKIYARREISKGFKFSECDEMMVAFESTFAFSETEDQESTISEVFCDMADEKPMDRLICGDVGFGKTEVALRAAAKCIFDGKQAAIIAPTTVLVMQHLITARERFYSFPVAIEGLSRLTERKKEGDIIKDLENGRIDLIIGTHKLLQDRIKFHDLGLVIIDEEHKFGVKDKEKLKSLKSSVDILTLTATPIPRTLQMAFVKIRDLSIIQTPPLNRQAIKTFVAPFSEKIIKDAIMSEKERGGQIFFVHNRISTIYSMADRLREIVPGISICVAHGRMNEKSLENTIIEFMLKKYDILLCTTIIGSGIDMPNVNTIIIDRADKLGLAELYQLRGRVGRSSRNAYAYLLIPKESEITLNAEERLNAIKRYQALGSGFEIATADLEIRGGGNLLGKSQSGFVNTIGLDMYTEMLNEAISSLRGEPVTHEIESEIKLPISALIPDTYISNSNQRIEIYRRLSNCKNDEGVDTIANEVEDRFGKLPKHFLNLLLVVKLKIRAKKLKIKKLDLNNELLLLSFDPSTSVSRDKLFSGISKIFSKSKIKFTGEYDLSLNLPKDYSCDLILFIKNFLNELS